MPAIYSTPAGSVSDKTTSVAFAELVLVITILYSASLPACLATAEALSCASLPSTYFLRVSFTVSGGHCKSAQLTFGDNHGTVIVTQFLAAVALSLHASHVWVVAPPSNEKELVLNSDPERVITLVIPLFT